MPVLRSREILPPNATLKTLKKPVPVEPPTTPAQTHEPFTFQSPSTLTPNTETPRIGPDSVSVSGSTRRRSLRLASKSQVPGESFSRNPTNGASCEEELRVFEGNSWSATKTERKRKLEVDDDLSGLESRNEEVTSLRSGKTIMKREIGNQNGRIVLNDSNVSKNASTGKSKWRSGGEGKGEVVDGMSLGFENESQELIDNEIKSNGSKLNEGREGNRGDKKGKRVLSGASEGCGADETLEKDQTGSGKGRKRYSREDKGKGLFIDDAVKGDGSDLICEREQRGGDEKGERGLNGESEERVVCGNESDSARGKRRYSREVRISESRVDQFRDIARQNASRFAHFDSHEEEENQMSIEAEREIPCGEDWPGPFSTAMKIIRDRGEKMNLKQGTSAAGKRECCPITWIPKMSEGCDQIKAMVPSLEELCMKILVRNVDAIASLENIPDAVRHKLSHMLCGSRRMNSHFFNLLIKGSPTEIRLRDCSWLTEEVFTKCFEGCDTKNLAVLQLDQCGRCMPDYVLLAMLARLSNNLPSLTTLSLSGACRLSDIGLAALASAAPALRSINLSQCSLLTPAGIDTLADKLGLVLQELYINDCQSIDAMLILPALKKLEHLEVLSVAGVQNVSDHFVREFVAARGHNMKELILTNCVNLTDSSLKVIAETCPKLCTLDLFNLCKLTDSALGYLANGCRQIQALKLCRNAFSDEAIAAFLETSGELLIELSLNSIKKVGHNTALSVAKRLRNLQSLDLSWCRSLTNEAMGLIVDSCLSLRVLKLFGCTQISNVFVNGHSNPYVRIIGLKMSPVLENLKMPVLQEAPLHYSSASHSV